MERVFDVETIYGMTGGENFVKILGNPKYEYIPTYYILIHTIQYTCYTTYYIRAIDTSKYIAAAKRT